MSTLLDRLLTLQGQLNDLIAEVQKSQPNAPKKVKRVKVIAETDKDAAKEAGSEAEKPKRVLSPEHLAKLKAGREVAKAKKAAEKEAEKAADASI
jgi:hypothetical protein